MAKTVKKEIVITTHIRPRLSVYRSLKDIHIQIIDDEKKITLFGAASFKEKGPLKDKATKMAEKVLEFAKEKKIKALRFDRGKFRYHGAIEIIAEKIREGGVTI